MIYWAVVLDAPDRPGKPVAKDWDKNNAYLKWPAPASDGGSPITSYIIEKKDQYRYEHILFLRKLLEKNVSVI